MDLVALAATYKKVTHAVAVGLVGAGTYLALHPDTVTLILNWAKAHNDYAIVSAVVTALIGLYHKPTPS